VRHSPRVIVFEVRARQLDFDLGYLMGKDIEYSKMVHSDLLRALARGNIEPYRIGNF